MMTVPTTGDTWLTDSGTARVLLVSTHPVTGERMVVHRIVESGTVHHLGLDEWDGTRVERCDECGGAGVVPEAMPRPDGTIRPVTISCPECGGRGYEM